MADVFLSYKRDERAAVETIASGLKDLGLTVWFDASMSAGETFNAEIDREARAAKVVLVCWSPAARQSEWVNAEAMIGFEQKKLAACYVAGPDGFSAPTPFNAAHTEDLRAWLAAPSSSNPAWKSVLRRVGKLCVRADIESWAVLDARSTATDLRAWIEANNASPMLMLVDELLRVRERADDDREKVERETRERYAREASEREARQQAERQARDAAARAWDQDVKIDPTGPVETTRIRARFEGIAIAIAAAVAFVVFTIWATQQTLTEQTRRSAEQPSTAPEPATATNTGNSPTAELGLGVFELSCAAFAGATEASLRQRFGNANVTHEMLNAPEGQTYDATILHLRIENVVERIEIVWNDETGHPFSVAVSGTSSLRGPNGLALEMSAAEVEQVNGRPFSIYGWEWDYGGYVHDWQGGNLDQGTCRVVGGFETRASDTSAVASRDAVGDTAFQSDSTAIRGANAHLVWFGLRFDRV